MLPHDSSEPYSGDTCENPTMILETLFRHHRRSLAPRRTEADTHASNSHKVMSKGKAQGDSFSPLSIIWRP